MLFLYINGVDRTGDLERNTLQKTNQIQQRADTLTFNIFQGSQPQANQDIKLYVGDTVASIVGAVIVLNGYFQRDISRFFPGQDLWIRIGQANAKKVTVLTYVESTLTLTLTAAPGITVNPGDAIGELQYGGIITRPKNVNIQVLQNIEYPTSCVDYTKIFDKKLISDSWANVDARYIINDFCNTTINYNTDIDNLSYADNTTIQAAWTESSDGSNPTVDSSDFLEQTSSGVFAWTHSGGTATWVAAPTTKDVSPWLGALTGTPTSGSIMIWLNPADFTKVTSIKLRIGSSSSNYAEVTLDALTANGWQYQTKKLDIATIVGTPNWALMHYAAIVVAETGSSSIKFNGFRVNADNSFTLYNVQSTTQFEDLRSNNQKPTSFMQLLAKNFQFVWFIDYERDIHFVSNSVTAAPYGLGDNTNNFFDLSIEVDQSNLANRIIVEGGQSNSISFYAQVFQGDNAIREWIQKSPFANMSVLIDNNTTTHAAEATTTTTSIKITAHGLSDGDHIINRTRSNAVREITVVDADHFTVQAVPSQTSGDTISFFSVPVTVGIENIDVEASFDYLGNFQNQSVRASVQTATLTPTSFIRFRYNEKIPIQIQYTDSASANGLKALGLGDGLFDAQPILDKSIQDITTAVTLAQAAIQDYKNPIIIGNFKTDQNGLQAGQIIVVQDSVRGINTSYVIQVVKSRQAEGDFNDYFLYEVTFGTTLFGIIEFYQKLLAIQGQIEENTTEIVETFVTASEIVSSGDVNAIALDGGFLNAIQPEIVLSGDVNVASKKTSGTWEYEASIGQTLPTRFNLADYG